MHDQLKRTQEDLSKKTAEVAILETKLSHSEQNAAKKMRMIIENVYGELSNAIGSVSDSLPDGDAARDAEQPAGNQSNSGEAPLASVVLPEGEEGPGEAARTPTEVADEADGEALKGDPHARGGSPSI